MCVRLHAAAAGARRRLGGPLPQPHPLSPALPAGNWIGGAFVVGLLSSAIYGSKANRLWAAWDRMAARCSERLARRGEERP